MPSVLISGASITGPALAYWLSRAGFQVTVVERAAGLRSGGQAIDIRGPALKVIEQMGLLPGVVALRTHHKGMTVLDRDGQEISRTTERTASAGRLNSGDVEIFRDDLSRLLVEAAQDKVEYIYRDSIEELEDDEASILASFRRASSRRFDIVIGADGLRSHVRWLAFDSDGRWLNPLGIGFAIYTTPNILGLEDWQLSFRDETSGYVIYPSRSNEDLRVNLGFALMPDEFPRGDPEAQREIILRRTAHLGGPIPQLLEHLPEASDLWFGPLAQVKMPSWSNGRVALVGDAAYCPSPFTGQGTSLAIVGAFVLAKELERSPAEPEAAFQRYEQRMRPFVTLNQDLLSLTRQGPAPDDVFDRAKNAIELSDYWGR
ncbi:FAD-dependent monooxygenase [Acidisoma cellulosilytica]|uniref:FAD-dependent monooxygenase n=1 Tax=Acidisoma cellulosilyticum TaxID=2802395 RepID=A0A963Z559_9PROT|nr:FAD-dependent monooxygenase [Acidisoma cellulosilyticum]MCB8882741.1 FAD-dependent monooxygenase [Acidisoma cellulosilyticum]